MGLTDYSIFLLGPAGLFHLRVEVVVPALTALLPQPALQVLGNQRPLFGAVLLDQLNDLKENISKGAALIAFTLPSRYLCGPHFAGVYRALSL